jgi:hypothetical protein
VVETLVLPVSRLVFLWRTDGYYRILGEDYLFDAQLGIDADCEEEWIRWTGTVYREGRGQGVWSEPGWWSTYGELPPGATVTVTLASGHEPQVRTIGRIWACEWVSMAQDSHMTVGDERYSLPFRKPYYLP